MCIGVRMCLIVSDVLGKATDRCCVLIPDRCCVLILDVYGRKDGYDAKRKRCCAV